MIRRSIFVILLFSCLGIISCEQTGSVEDISWMIGHWQGIDVNDLSFHENWERSGKSSFAGTGCTISPDGDTLWKESLKVELVEGVPYYVASTPGNKGAVLFRMIKGNEKQAVFENKEHDFPQRISYTLETKNTVKVKLEGLEHGQPKIQHLQFERVLNDSLLIQPL